jgi:hypothetical protein
MPKYQLNYHNQTFELSLYDDFYITIDDERLNNVDELSCDIECILLSMMDKNMTSEQWMSECDIYFTVTKDGIEIKPDNVRYDMIDEVYKQTMIDEEK